MTLKRNPYSMKLGNSFAPKLHLQIMVLYIRLTKMERQNHGYLISL